ncbi:MAG: hypothetical protein ABIK28_16875, partial [Planctomycetota bacterium]
IEVLNRVLDTDDSVQRVIPGHRELWSREKLVLWRDYIVSLWETVIAAAAAGQAIDAVREHCPLGKPYYYMQELGHSEEEIARFHDQNIRAFWRQTQESAADRLEAALSGQGIEAAAKLFEKLLEERGKGILFEEADFNNLGYALMQRGDLEAAISVFEMNVLAFPESWNVYDSLGEALLNHGQTERAVKNYTRSIELNPANENGKSVLKRIAAPK